MPVVEGILGTETTAPTGVRSSWIHGPLVDLVMFDFAWILPCLWYFWLGHTHDRVVCDYTNLWRCSSLTQELAYSMLIVSYLHRNYTFALIYGDRGEFSRHRKLYTWAPLVLFSLLLPFGFYQFFPAPYREFGRIALYAITIPNGVWNVFHVFMQKYGFLRAYGLKLGYGNAKLEKTLILSWLFCGIFLLLAKYDDSIFYQRMAVRNFYLFARYLPLLRYVRMLAYPAFAWLVIINGAWIAQELRHFTRASIPKLLYAATTFLVFFSFGYSILLGFIALVTSHSLEYIGFVNIYGRRKPGLPRWIRNPFIFNPVLIFGVLAFYQGLKILVGIRGIYIAYMNCESYLHFLFDGYLWKLRDPATREVVLKMDQPGKVWQREA